MELYIGPSVNELADTIESAYFVQQAIKLIAFMSNNMCNQASLFISTNCLRLICSYPNELFRKYVIHVLLYVMLIFVFMSLQLSAVMVQRAPCLAKD